ncbi:MAG: metallophosphoesterase family protein, partial [Candidatus Pacebacteria bacterium]|nr:metallophosphoesterase family protein [Candidatus Paceibacterota bacterium]
MPDCHTLIVSDIHLGSKVCRTGKILSLLNESTFKTLIVNGDLFDSNDIGRLNAEHWKVLDLISSLTKEHKVYLIGGNHGRKLDKMAKKLGITLEEELLFSVGNRQFLCFHGDEFDAFIKHLPLTTSVFTKLYYAIQQFDGNEQRVSMILKKLS